MKPYYQDDNVTLYHGDCLEILPHIVADVLVTDPPYGIGLDTENRSRGRSKLTKSNDYPPVHGDDKPFDPTPFLCFDRMVIFGANNFAEKLPPSQAWIVWDRLDGIWGKREQGFNDGADAELAWTNLPGTVRTYRHRWLGMMRKGEPFLHPTQKPIGLMMWAIEKASDPGDIIFDPFAGSGSTLRAAKDLGRKAIGIEIDESYCEIIVKRLAQEVLL